MKLLFGNAAGGYGDKFNRVAKLAAMKQSLIGKLDDFIGVGSVTERSRCALATKLMMLTGIRIGNEDSAEGYVSKRKDAFGRTIQTYGVTTLKPKFVKVSGATVQIKFVGKREVKQNIVIKDAKLAKQVIKILAECHDTFVGVTDYDVRCFIQRSVGKKFMAKDFRTLYANECAEMASTLISKKPAPKRKSDANAEVKAICVHVAEQLGNTPSVCKKSYVDPRLLEYHVETRLKTR